MVFTSIFLAALAATAMAVPTARREMDQQQTFYEALNRSCTLPDHMKAAPNLDVLGLTKPGNQRLEFIAVGRGIQVNTHPSFLFM
jgi:hypothetical protein